MPGPGYGKRTRQCNNPAPDGGEDCPGPNILDDDCLMLHREARGNPYDFFEKTFREYQNGFESRGVEFLVPTGALIVTKPDIPAIYENTFSNQLPNECSWV